MPLSAIVLYVRLLSGVMQYPGLPIFNIELSWFAGCEARMCDLVITMTPAVVPVSDLVDGSAGEAEVIQPASLGLSMHLNILSPLQCVSMIAAAS